MQHGSACTGALDGSGPDCTTTSNYVNAQRAGLQRGRDAAGDDPGRSAIATRAGMTSSGTTSDIWNNLSNGVHTEKVECKTDNGVHGDGTSTSKTYAANKGSGPWTTSIGSNKITWSNYTEADAVHGELSSTTRSRRGPRAFALSGRERGHARGCSRRPRHQHRPDALLERR